MRNSTKLIIFGIFEMIVFVVCILRFKYEPLGMFVGMGTIAFVSIVFMLVCAAVIHDNTENG